MAVSYKFYHGATQPANFEVGSIWFDSASHCINVKTSTAVETYGGVIDASVNGSILTITKADGSTVDYEIKDYEAGDGISIAGVNVSVSHDDTLEIDENKKLSVKNALSDTEKKWIADQLFAKLFTGSISASPSSSVFSGSDISVTFTLSTKYDGVAVDLDSVPDGWTRTTTGTYTKTGTINSTTGSSISSGSVNCVYNGNTKSVGGASSSNIKYSFYIESTAESLSSTDLDALVDSTAAKISTSNSLSGDKKYTMSADGYLYFVIANTSSISDVQAMNVSILQSKTPVNISRTNYGSYKVYRSAAKLGAGEQSFTIK